MESGEGISLPHRVGVTNPSHGLQASLTGVGNGDIVDGHLGFIGWELDYALRQAGHTVKGFDVTGCDAYGSLFPDFQKDYYPGLVIHCGGESDSFADINRVMDANYGCTRYLAQWISDLYYQNIRIPFVYFSSSTAIQPTSAYGWSKRIAEDFLSYVIPNQYWCILRR